MSLRRVLNDMDPQIVREAISLHFDRDASGMLPERLRERIAEIPALDELSKHLVDRFVEVSESQGLGDDNTLAMLAGAMTVMNTLVIASDMSDLSRDLDRS